MKLSEDAKNDISSDISNAESAISLGNYAQANEYYLQAKAKMDVLETGGGGGGLGGLLGGKGGSKEAAPNYVQGGYNENLGGYNF